MDAGRCPGCGFDDARWTDRDSVTTRGRVSGPTLHRFQHQLHESARARHRAGDGVTTITGRVAHLHIGAGGVPKGPVDAFSVTWSGPAGDRQRTRRHHGRPSPVSTGRRCVPASSSGWVRCRAEISSYAIPCSQNRAWFADGDFNRVLHDRHPGSSRLYATVLQPGHVKVGDPVVIEPND